MNVQSATVEPLELRGFVPDPEMPRDLCRRSLAPQIQMVLEQLRRSQRPVLLAGSGIRLARAERLFLDVVEQLGIPVVTAFNAHDLIWNDHPCYVGRQGTIGDRAGNFAVQNADFLLVLGCRLTIRQVSYNWENFARAAYKIVVDIDEAELKKPTIHPDLPIRADASDFLEAFREVLGNSPQDRFDTWRRWCMERKERYPVVLSEYWKDDSAGINPYCFVQELFRRLDSSHVVVTGDGTACITTFQAAALKEVSDSTATAAALPWDSIFPQR